MAKNIVYLNKDATYMSKKHFCPNCKAQLSSVKVSKVLNDDSEEAQNMPKMFSKTLIGSRGISFRSYKYVGDTKYVWKEFECPNCQSHFTVEEMKKAEGVSSAEDQDYSLEEVKKSKFKKILLYKILPIGIIALIAIVQYFVMNIK